MDDSVRIGWLRKLGELHDERQRGKILQRLLELAFADLGFRIVDERIVEGVDFDTVHRVDPNRRYSFEVRTSVETTVPVKPEDLRQLAERDQDGYETGVAAMQISPGSKWILVKGAWLRVGKLRLSLGTSLEWESLGRDLNDAFDSVIERLGSLAMGAGLDGLEPYLRQAMKQ